MLINTMLLFRCLSDAY